MFLPDELFLDGMAKIAGRKNVIAPALSLGLLYLLRDQSRVRDGLADRGVPAAEDEDRSPDVRSGTRARAQAPARLNNEEKSVTFLDAPISTEKGMRGIHDGVGLGGEV